MDQTPQDVKQYFVVTEVRLSAFKILRPNTVVMLGQEEAEPLMAANFIMPLYTAIKAGLYPPKEQQSPLAKVVEKVTETLTGKPQEEKTEMAKVPSQPQQPSELVQNLKAHTKQRSAKSLSFENELRKKIQEKKKAARQS
jgi:hypothetical protein